MNKKYKLLYVEWIDAVANASWQTFDSLKDWLNETDGLISHVGWLLAENEKYIVLGSRMGIYADEMTEVGLIQKIPKAWVVKRRVIKV